MTIDNETKERAKAYVAAQAKKETEQLKEVVPVKQKEDIAAKVVPVVQGRDYTAATKMAVKVIKNFEQYSQFSYPDPASDLYKTLSQHGKLKAFMDGTNRELPEEWESLDGSPFTCGYGETEGVTKDTIYCSEEAESRLFAKVEGLVAWAIKTSPRLAQHSSEKIAAVVSLIYNIGEGNYSQSTVCKKIAAGDMRSAGDAFTMWTKAQGQVLQGLVNRRNTERALFLSKTA